MKKFHELNANDEVTQPGDLAAKRDKTDNTCRQTTAFGIWRATPPSGYTFGDEQPTFDSETSKWTWYVEGTGVAVDAESGTSTADATSVTFTFNDSGTKSFTATRSKNPATNGNTFVTDDYVASQFTRDNTSLFGLCRYPISPLAVTDGAATATDSAVNTITLSANTTISVPASTGKARDWIVYVTEDSTTAYTITFNGTFVKDFTSWPTIAVGEKYVFSFTELATNTFLAAYKKVS